MIVLCFKMDLFQATYIKKVVKTCDKFKKSQRSPHSSEGRARPW